eukprot:161106-Prorocentrum_minimum.AAC.1
MMIYIILSLILLSPGIVDLFSDGTVDIPPAAAAAGQGVGGHNTVAAVLGRTGSGAAGTGAERVAGRHAGAPAVGGGDSTPLAEACTDDPAADTDLRAATPQKQRAKQAHRLDEAAVVQ